MFIRLIPKNTHGTTIIRAADRLFCCVGFHFWPRQTYVMIFLLCFFRPYLTGRHANVHYVFIPPHACPVLFEILFRNRRSGKWRGMTFFFFFYRRLHGRINITLLGETIIIYVSIGRHAVTVSLKTVKNMTSHGPEIT